MLWRLAMPHWSMNLWKAADMYSPALSSCTALIFALSWFSVYALNVLKASKASDLRLRDCGARSVDAKG